MDFFILDSFAMLFMISYAMVQRPKREWFSINFIGCFFWWILTIIQPILTRTVFEYSNGEKHIPMVAGIFILWFMIMMGFSLYNVYKDYLAQQEAQKGKSD